MCFWYNDTCKHYPVPAAPDCPKVICFDPSPEPPPSTTTSWLVPILSVCALLLLVVLGVTTRISCQLYRASRRRRNHFDERQIVEDLRAARAESEQLERDLEEIRRSLGIPSFDNFLNSRNVEESVETIEDAMRQQDEEAEVAETARIQAEQAAAEAAARAERIQVQQNIRSRLLDTATTGRNRLTAHIRRAAGRVPNLNARLGRILEEQRARLRRNSEASDTERLYSR